MTTAMRIRDALIFAVLMTVLDIGQSGQSHREEKDEDIAEFYSTGSTIQTLYTTMGKTACKVDNVNATGSVSTEFQRRLGPEAKGQRLQLVGKFMNTRYAFGGRPFNAMDVTLKTGRDFEIRSKNGNSTPQGCHDKFKSHTRRAGIVASKIWDCNNAASRQTR
ncbi:uncharacterized protein LOC119373547 isoform X2 [Rhipicephalus sanguineus]|uniref:uncharacterized protein LOC119373547 isoform X2 n=1 Tax=Rhipicephalus sanguineus TaxID=34632 RepID=UPI00189561C2|nr:uncharacterized protein LOC119373547 isoform X2 [Rhipicephalus sanguineus]